MSIQYEGVVLRTDPAKKEDYLFRLSLKALIKNDKGEILVVKESGRDFWDLPGGGMDHGEDIRTALARELYEEVGLQGDFSYEVVQVADPGILLSRPVWQIRIVFIVKPQTILFKKGKDSDAIQFVDADIFKDSPLERERQVYEYSLLIK